jgi:hypothetical protein
LVGWVFRPELKKVQAIKSWIFRMTNRIALVVG